VNMNSKGGVLSLAPRHFADCVQVEWILQNHHLGVLGLAPGNNEILYKFTIVFSAGRLDHGSCSKEG
jgi:hypothetical protein